MKVSRFIKREDKSTQYGSKGWTMEVTPADLGLSEPKSIEEAQKCGEQLAAFAQVMVCGQMVRDGQMTPEEFAQVAAPFASVITSK